jgi:hypothetical protein
MGGDPASSAIDLALCSSHAPIGLTLRLWVGDALFCSTSCWVLPCGACLPLSFLLPFSNKWNVLIPDVRFLCESEKNIFIVEYTKTTIGLFVIQFHPF